MNNVLVYCETEQGQVAEVSLELLTKGRSLANELNCQLEALLPGNKLGNTAQQLFPYGVDIVHLAEHKALDPYMTLPHARIAGEIIKKEQPQVVLIGATPAGRDLAPRLASSLSCGLTADCTSLEIGDHYDKKSKKEYKSILYQIRPAFGGSIIATIISPDHKPQMATVREGVMKKEILDTAYQGEIRPIEAEKSIKPEDKLLQLIDRHVEKSDVDIKNSPIIIAGGYGMGSKENFDKLFDLADALGGDVAASRAAVDAGFATSNRQVGQTGITVRPKLYIACGISGAVQHRAGMDKAGIIISINTDETAPINAIADYHIHGDVNEVIPKLIEAYHTNSK